MDDAVGSGDERGGVELGVDGDERERLSWSKACESAGDGGALIERGTPMVVVLQAVAAVKSEIARQRHRVRGSSGQQMFGTILSLLTQETRRYIRKVSLVHQVHSVFASSFLDTCSRLESHPSARSEAHCFSSTRRPTDPEPGTPAAQAPPPPSAVGAHGERPHRPHPASSALARDQGHVSDTQSFSPPSHCRRWLRGP